MPTEIEKVVQDISSLVSPPEVWLRINEVVNDPSSSAADVAQVTSNDPSLTATVLKMVNSSWYNFPSKIDTVSRAITILGMNELFDLITAVSAAKVFTRIPNQLVRPDTFWRHSICTGIIAKRIAHTAGILHPERMYVSGMLHDIGSLVIYSKFPEKASDALLAAQGDEEVCYDVEQDLLGFSHAELGAALLKLWNLPAALIDSVRWHHEPGKSDIPGMDAAIVHVANVSANNIPVGSFTEVSETPVIEPDVQAMDMLGISDDQLSQFGTDLEREIIQAIAIMIPPPRTKFE